MVQGNKSATLSEVGTVHHGLGTLHDAHDQALVHGGFHEIMRLPLRQPGLQSVKSSSQCRARFALVLNLGSSNCGSLRKPPRFPWDFRLCQRW